MMELALERPIAQRKRAAREAAFFVALTWVQTLAIALALPHAGIAPLIAIVTPTIATVLVIMLVTPREDRRSVWKAVGFSRPSWQSLVLAVALPAAITLVSFGGAVALGVARLAGVNFSPGAIGREVLDLAVSVGLFAIVFLGEEIGWRGYLLPRLTSSQPPSRTIESNGPNGEINRWRQSAVQPQLLLEKMAPLVQSRIVEKGEPYGLLHLVNQIARQKDMGDVSLFVDYFMGRLGIKAGVHHRQNEPFLGARLRLPVLSLQTPHVSSYVGGFAIAMPRLKTISAPSLSQKERCAIFSM